MKAYCIRGVARLLIPLLVMLNSSPWAIAADNAPLSDTKIVHQPPDAVPAGMPVTVTATVEDSAGIELVRVYFKSTVGTIYYYVPLAQGKGNAYSGTIPAPAADAGTIEYLILVKNNKNVVVKSQQYQTPVTEKTDQPLGKQKAINVYSESPHASKHIIGFTNGYDFQVAEPSEKYGVVAGLYNPESVSWIATDAVAGGTATEPAAETEKSWTPYLIGGGAIAGVAVVAMALGGGGGGGGDDSAEGPSTPDTPPANETPLASGTWRLTSYQNTSSCTSGTGATQTVTCGAAKTFDAVSPASVAVTVPDSATPGACIAGTTAGLAEVFVAGQDCDAVKACNSFSASNLTSKTCETTRITLARDNGTHTQVWQKQ